MSLTLEVLTKEQTVVERHGVWLQETACEHTEQWSSLSLAQNNAHLEGGEEDGKKKEWEKKPKWTNKRDPVEIPEKDLYLKVFVMIR